MSSFNEQVFRKKVSNCLSIATQVLERNKHLDTPDNVSHRYEDKYLVADYLTNAGIISYLNCLVKLGVSPEQLGQFLDWASTQSVTLNFKVVDKCEFVKEIKRDEEDATKYKTEVAGFAVGSFTSKVIRTITEYEYRYSATYELVAFRGVGASASDRIQLMTRSATQKIIRSSQSFPYPEKSMKEFDVNISWLLRTVSRESKEVTFAVDRKHKDCRTPSRNKDIEGALEFFGRFKNWTDRVAGYLRNEFFNIELTHSSKTVKPDLSAINTESILVPVVPLVVDPEADTAEPGSGKAIEDTTSPASVSSNNSSSAVQASVPSNSAVTYRGSATVQSVTLSSSLVTQLLNEQSRSVDAKCTRVVDTLFPSPAESTALITAMEARLMVILLHMGDVAAHLRDGIDFIESMLRKQLVSAIGKELKATDFSAYMTFHCRKVFREAYQPKPFSQAVRRSVNHSPEGSVRIEQHNVTPGETTGTFDPVYTISHNEGSFPMQMALNASTRVTFGGDRVVHGMVVHSFSGSGLPTLRLAAQARQFSGYMVFVGRIASATTFEPKYGMIVQNKDEIYIPLSLEQIPTPKAFRDAIESLSPEQQRFARAYRAMQLESSLFGILVIQIKPQLEKVLNLSADALTKEIKLTQELMELFIKYQIPSDLLSYDEQRGNEDGFEAVTTSSMRLNSVKENVKAINDMIKTSKDEELAERVQEAKYARPDLDLLSNFDCDMQLERISMVDAVAITRSTSKGMSFFGGGGSSGRKMAKSSITAAVAPKPASSAAPRRMAAGSAPPPSVSAVSSGPVVTTNTTTGVTATTPKDVAKPDTKIIEKSSDAEPTDTSVSGPHADLTQIPVLLDQKYEELDVDAALKPTIINPGASWTKRSQKALLAEPTESTLGASELERERNAAFDLLDALSKSGALTIDCAELHVVIAATHCFDQSVMDTLVQGNVNPIERVERSALIMATTLHHAGPEDLLEASHVSRVKELNPRLF
jgi:hypothetical protein